VNRSLSVNVLFLECVASLKIQNFYFFYKYFYVFLSTNTEVFSQTAVSCHFKTIQDKMNVQKNILTTLLLMMTFFSCQETGNKREFWNDNKEDIKSSKLTQKFLIDYKSETYKIFIGDNYKSSDKTIDWSWTAFNDPDDKLDSTGIDAFLFLGEPLLKYNDDDWLPTLHIETDKNLIKKFSCSILFDLDETENAEINFLKLLSQDINQLQNDSLTKSLIVDHIYEKVTHDFIETFRLTKGKEFEYDKFEYTVKQK
ncbi:MAG TPA: hypothetical protein VLZ83_06670, partial [Edaphocola sp.]|nr:hypothetical protein [Edaphocola sp.]